MSAVEVRLRELREFLTDPDHVVLNPRHLSEDADGTGTLNDERATRFCVVSGVRHLFDQDGYTIHPVIDAIYDTMRANGDDRGLGRVMIDGDYMQVIEAAIAAREEQ